MFIYTIYLREYDGSGYTVSHMKSFTSLDLAEEYRQELERGIYDCEVDTCCVLNELY